VILNLFASNNKHALHIPYLIYAQSHISVRSTCLVHV